MGLVYPHGLLENWGCPEGLPHTRYVLYIKVRGVGNVARMIEYLPTMHELPGPTSVHCKEEGKNKPGEVKARGARVKSPS